MGVRSLAKRALPAPLRARLRATLARTQRSASQLGQDFWVFGEAFAARRGGFFVDVGAADGVSLSNTLLLEKRYGWSGICVEADPDAFEQLRHARSAVCVNVCLDATEGSVEFVRREQLSGIVGAGTDNAEAAGEVLVLPTRPLADVLREHAAPRSVDYLSLDVEGAEDRVLAGFPFDEFCFRTMTVERPQAALREVLARSGYRLVREHPGLDAFYVHESFVAEYSRNAYAFWSRFRGAVR